jgi:hypothetical protein
MPTQLHIALQHHYAGENGLIEAWVDGFRADVIRDDVIYEIQTASIASLRRKLEILCKKHTVVLVSPQALSKTIVRIDPDTGEILSQRRSPKHGEMTHVLPELMAVAELLKRKRLSLEIALTVEREVRAADGRGSWRRKGVSVVGHELVEMRETMRFDTPADFLALLPAELPRKFTVADLAATMTLTTTMAGRAAYALRKMGTIRHVGKRGNAFVYERKRVRAR